MNKISGVDDLSQKILSLVRESPAARLATEVLSPFGDVFVVGGAPRDVILNKKPKDLDMMAKVPGEVIEHVLGTIPKAKVALTGKQFPVYRLMYQGDEVEIALPRTEVKTGPGNKDWAIKSDHSIPVETDLERRDFTSNAIAVNAATGEVHDPFGGVNDILRGVVKTVSPTSFRDDSSRTMRALTQISKHGLQPDEETMMQMLQHAPHLNKAARELIGQEFDKIISGKYPHDAFRVGHKTGVLEHFLPDVHNAFGFDQKNPHHKHDLGEHLLHVLKGTAEQTDDPDVRIAALLHDIGKPHSMWLDENGVGHFYRGAQGQGANHEEVGADMADKILRDLRFPANRINRISGLIRGHMFPAFNSRKGARKFLNFAGTPDNARDLITLRQADHMGKGNENATKLMADGMRGLLDEELQNNSAFSAKDLAINGRDVIQALGIKPGPAVGQVLQQVLDLVIDNPQLNNRADLISIIQSLGNRTAATHDREREKDLDLDKGIEATRIPGNGFTFNHDFSMFNGPGIAVALTDGAQVMPESVFNRWRIHNFRNAQRRHLRRDPNLKIGTWNSDGLVYIDPVKILHNLDEAIALAKEHDQQAIYNFDTKEVIPIEHDNPTERISRWDHMIKFPR